MDKGQTVFDRTFWLLIRIVVSGVCCTRVSVCVYIELAYLSSSMYRICADDVWDYGRLCIKRAV